MNAQPSSRSLPPCSLLAGCDASQGAGSNPQDEKAASPYDQAASRRCFEEKCEQLHGRSRARRDAPPKRQSRANRCGTATLPATDDTATHRTHLEGGYGGRDDRRNLPPARVRRRSRLTIQAPLPTLPR